MSKDRTAEWKGYYQRNKARIIARMKAAYLANPDAVKARAKQWRATNLERRNQYEAEYKRKNAAKIKAYFAARFQANREESYRICREWRKKNPAAAAAYSRSSYAARKETIKSQRAKIFSNDPERIRGYSRKSAAKSKAKKAARAKLWFAKNKAQILARRKARNLHRTEHLKTQRHAEYLRAKPRYRAGVLMRRARLRGARGPSDRAAYFRFVKHVASASRLTCYWCSRIVPKADRHVDHIIPVSKGGADDVFNLCCSCSDCNRTKNAKLPHQFSGQYEIVFVRPIEKV